jgi:hypothetical protein
MHEIARYRLLNDRQDSACVAAPFWIENGKIVEFWRTDA